MCTRFVALQARWHISASASPDWQRLCFVCCCAISKTLRSSESDNQGKDGHPNSVLTIALLPELVSGLSYTITVDQA